MRPGLFGIRRRLGRKLEPVKLHTAKKWDVDPELERRQEIARRILVDEGRNVDRPRADEEFYGPIG